jgi:hypothetical protein
MAASMTVTVEKNPFMDALVPFTIIIDWISHTDGTLTLPICSTYTAQLVSKSASPIWVGKVQGVLRLTQTIPGLNGDRTTSLPDAYTLAIKDQYGDDILDNAGVATARSATVSDRLIPATKRFIDSELTVYITGANSGKKGRIRMEFEDQGYAKL